MDAAEANVVLTRVIPHHQLQLLHHQQQQQRLDEDMLPLSPSGGEVRRVGCVKVTLAEPESDTEADSVAPLAAAEATTTAAAAAIASTDDDNNETHMQEQQEQQQQRRRVWPPFGLFKLIHTNRKKNSASRLSATTDTTTSQDTNL